MIYKIVISVFNYAISLTSIVAIIIKLQRCCRRLRERKQDQSSSKMTSSKEEPTVTSNENIYEKISVKSQEAKDEKEGAFKEHTYLPMVPIATPSGSNKASLSPPSESNLVKDEYVIHDPKTKIDLTKKAPNSDYIDF